MSYVPSSAADPAGIDPVYDRTTVAPTASAASAVSWGAILAGATGAAALSLILLLLGSGLGLSSVSPWAAQGASATTLGVAGIFWITFTQLAASGMGGYLAGRLRTRWIAVHTDEVYFRDTAHGFLAWAVATLVTAAFLASAIGGVVGLGAKTGAAVAGTAVTAGAAGAAGMASAGSASGASGAAPSPSAGYNYFIDSLFRPAPATAAGSAASAPAPAADTTAAPATDMGAAGTASPAMASSAPTAPASPAPARNNEPMNPATVTEVGRILVNSLRADALPAEDVRYVGGLVAQRTGLSQQDAEKRVTDTYAKAKAKLQDAETATREAADKARKASATAALWLFISLLIGAFVAAFAATFGGRRRDL